MLHCRVIYDLYAVYVDIMFYYYKKQCSHIIDTPFVL